ncbi:hypothetical protein CF65_02621 [Aggregatibacter actinomycetemcomitans HK1651]|nr:hypothetical protein CF65_02621 [Aggregatibacter actinomycetemcomitans HK1651]
MVFFTALFERSIIFYSQSTPKKQLFIQVVSVCFPC